MTVFLELEKCNKTATEDKNDKSNELRIVDSIDTNKATVNENVSLTVKKDQ